LASINSEGEFVWINYLKQIKELNIEKLTDNSNGTTGRQKLAADLKQLVEADYPNISGTLKKWNIDKYETILNGYLKARNSFGEDKDKIQNIIKSRNNKYLLDIGATSDLGTYANPDVGIVPDLLEKVNSVNSAALTEGKTIPNQMTKSFFSSNKQERYVQYSTLLNIINESNPNPINELNKIYNLNKSHNNNIDKPNNVANLVFYLPPIKHEKDDQINHSNFLLTSHIYYDPYSNPNNDSNYGHEGEGDKFIQNTSKDTTKPSLYYYKTSKFFKDFFSGANVNYPKDVSQLREWVNRFYNDFYNLIDLNAPEDKWLFEKDDFLKQLKVVESFAKKISEYIAAYEEESKSPTEENVKKAIQVDKILHFFQTSQLGKLIQANVDKVYREAPFAMLQADPASGEDYVVRGIIDGYILFDNRIVLFDYKTDKFTNSQAIKERYRGQMTLYAQALSQSYNIQQVDSYLILLGGEKLEVVEI